MLAELRAFVGAVGGAGGVAEAGLAEGDAAVLAWVVAG